MRSGRLADSPPGPAPPRLAPVVAPRAVPPGSQPPPPPAPAPSRCGPGRGRPPTEPPWPAALLRTRPAWRAGRRAHHPTTGPRQAHQAQAAALHPPAAPHLPNGATGECRPARLPARSPRPVRRASNLLHHRLHRVQLSHEQPPVAHASIPAVPGRSAASSAGPASLSTRLRSLRPRFRLLGALLGAAYSKLRRLGRTGRRQKRRLRLRLRRRRRRRMLQRALELRLVKLGHDGFGARGRRHRRRPLRRLRRPPLYRRRLGQRIVSLRLH
eukprot:scaffold15822_cov108-Isochrysis_galbana.AAC.8